MSKNESIKIPRICQYCHKEFEVTPSSLKQYPCKFCSLECRIAAKRVDPLEYFLSSQKPSETSDCILWTGSTTGGGYGSVRVLRDGKYHNMVAHRFSYEHHFGVTVPRELCVCHKCDTPACVNPDHLFLGTLQDNIQDRDAKGRTAKGERSHLSKLTAVQVDEIRRRFAQGGITRFALAREYGVVDTTICYIISRRTWK